MVERQLPQASYEGSILPAPLRKTAPQGPFAFGMRLPEPLLLGPETQPLVTGASSVVRSAFVKWPLNRSNCGQLPPHGERYAPNCRAADGGARLPWGSVSKTVLTRKNCH